MNKHQEKIFKNYIADIEQLTRDIADSIDLSLHDDAYRQIKERSKLKINFLHWFKKQIK